MVRQREPFEIALGIASCFNFRNLQFWYHYSLVWLFLDEGRFGDAHAHVEHSKSHVVNNEYILGRAMVLRTCILFMQGRFEEAKAEFLGAAEAFGKLGAMGDLEWCRELLQCIPVATHKPDSECQNRPCQQAY